MFDTCYTNNESCFSFDNAACETLRTNKGRRSLVSRDRRSCKGGDDSFAKNFVSSCDDVPARAEYLTRRSMQRNAQRAVSALRVHAALNLTARVALREAARNSMNKLAAAVNPPVVWLPVCADDVAVKDSAACTQCETGSLPARMEDREGWWHTACVYMTVYGPVHEMRECSYHAEARSERRNAAHPERIPAPAITTEELAAMPAAKLEALVKTCNARLDALHKAPVYWTGAQAWTDLLTYANSELRYRRTAC